MIAINATDIFNAIGTIFVNKYKCNAEESKQNTEAFAKIMSNLVEIAKTVSEKGFTSQTVEDLRNLVENSEELSDEDKIEAYKIISSIEETEKKNGFKRVITFVLSVGVVGALGICAVKTGKGLASIPNFMLNSFGRTIKTVFA